MVQDKNGGILHKSALWLIIFLALVLTALAYLANKEKFNEPADEKEPVNYFELKQ